MQLELVSSPPVLRIAHRLVISGYYSTIYQPILALRNWSIAAGRAYSFRILSDSQIEMILWQGWQGCEANTQVLALTYTNVVHPWQDKLSLSSLLRDALR